MSYLNTKVARDAFALYLGRGTNIIVGLVSTLIYGLVFLKTQIAVISLFEMILNLFTSFGFTWSTLALTRFGKEELQRHHSINNTSSIRIGIVLPLFFVSTLFIITFRNDLLKYIGTTDHTIIIYLIFNLILFIIHEHIIYICTTVEQHFQNVLYYFGQSIGKVGILMIFYFGLSNNNSAELYLKLNVVLLFVLLIVRLFFFESKYVFPITRIKVHDLTEQLKYVLPQIYGFGGLYIVNWVDVYFIRRYLNFEELGAYQFMYAIFLKLASFAIIINTIFFPRIMDWKTKSVNNLTIYLKKGPIILLLASLICFGIVLYSYQPLFYIFFKAKYQNAYSAFNILLLSLPFYFVTFLYVPVLNSFDRVRYIQTVFVFSGLCNVLIDYFFIKTYGLIAAAVGTFVAYFSLYILLSYAVGKMFNINHRLLNTVSALIFFSVLIYVIRTY